MILDPGLNLRLRPMAYPQFWAAYKASVANGWRVEEVDLSRDIADLRVKMTDGERHLIKRLVAFFATGDALVANNVALSLYRHVNAPEARLYFSRQLFEEALHSEMYLTILDTYVTDDREREAMFAAVETVPVIAAKAAFCARHMDTMMAMTALTTDSEKQVFILNLLTFASAVEGLFFYGAFAYVFFLRSRGMLPGLGQATNWVMRDETCHMRQAFEVVNVARQQRPDLFTDALWSRYRLMLKEAVDLESTFALDVLGLGVAGLSARDMRTYLESVADERLVAMGQRPEYGASNPFGFLDQQSLPEIANFFERRSTAYSMSTSGGFTVDADF